MAEEGTPKATDLHVIARQLTLGTRMPALVLWTVAGIDADYPNAILAELR